MCLLRVVCCEGGLFSTSPLGSPLICFVFLLSTSGFPLVGRVGLGDSFWYCVTEAGVRGGVRGAYKHLSAHEHNATRELGHARASCQ